MLRELVRSLPLTKLVAADPNWLGTIRGNGISQSARMFEEKSFLGAFLRPTSIEEMDISRLQLVQFGVLAPFTATAYYPDPMAGGGPDQPLESAHAGVRHLLQLHYVGIHDLLRSLLKAPTLRPAVLDYFAEALRVNAKRVQLSANQAACTSDGFAMSLSVVAVRLCSPFTESRPPGFMKIDSTYLLKPGCRVDLTDEARMGMVASEVASAATELLAKDTESTKPTNFVTEMFFLALQALHLGSVPLFSRYPKVIQIAAELQRRKDAGEDRLRDRLAVIVRAKWSLEGQLLDPVSLGETLRFYSFVAAWLCRLADPAGTEELAENPDTIFLTLPECVYCCTLAYTNMLLVLLSCSSDSSKSNSGTSSKTWLMFFGLFLDTLPKLWRVI